MAILSFWSGDKKETSQTCSIAALATYMSVEHNYKTLIIDASFDDDTFVRCFWKPDANRELKKQLNKGKMDIATGTEGLMSAVASNKTSPEIITNYTKVIFKNRLDLLAGMKTSIYEDFKKTLELYPDMIKAANKFYDLVIVDLPKTADNPVVTEILQKSHVVMYTMSQSLKQIDKFIEDRDNMKELKQVIPLIGSANIYCKYNPKNVASYVRDRELAHIRYNNTFLQACNEGEVAKFFLNTRISKNAKDRNSEFLKSVSDTSQKIIHRFELVRYGKILNSK